MFLLLVLSFGWAQAAQVKTAKVIDRDSDAYKLGWIEGRLETTIEGLAIEEFHRCVRKRSPEQCWQEQLDSGMRLFDQIDSYSARQKLQLFADPDQHRWIKNLRGKGDPTDMPAYMR